MRSANEISLDAMRVEVKEHLLEAGVKDPNQRLIDIGNLGDVHVSTLEISEHHQIVTIKFRNTRSGDEGEITFCVGSHLYDELLASTKPLQSFSHSANGKTFQIVS